MWLTDNQGPVVRKAISTKPRVKFNLGFFFFCSKAFSRIFFWQNELNWIYFLSFPIWIQI